MAKKKAAKKKAAPFKEVTTGQEKPAKKGLLEELVERGLSVARPLLVVIDGAKALRRAVNDVLGEKTPVQRCTVHKKRNALKHLSKRNASWVSRRMSMAYDLNDAEEARKELLALAAQLEKINPSAARSLQEGLEETLTVQKLGLPEDLRRSLRSTNIIESAINGVRDRSRNVKRWRDGQQIERWTAAGLLETEKNFRRIKGCMDIAVLLARRKRPAKLLCDLTTEGLYVHVRSALTVLMDR